MIAIILRHRLVAGVVVKIGIINRVLKVIRDQIRIRGMVIIRRLVVVVLE